MKKENWKIQIGLDVGGEPLTEELQSFIEGKTFAVVLKYILDEGKKIGERLKQMNGNMIYTEEFEKTLTKTEEQLFALAQGFVKLGKGK